ncbi:hypothetical protein BJF85_08160 [Saccharomonospora sp. CUA-673]|uniref:DUF2334 domain-containing protein n=1 Tax=Saccharomonospora sp. CUA-673 TaxID=1904969 RepID=UPI00096681D3|nr:DUF2334 domain-containing protein [Saccharomonospora sp. CUA-673]OLT38674.1 hypothetical protein BJF85_08160 [Saccharomonospora sp. CUA-673]
MGGVEPSLLVSLSGVNVRTLERCADLARELDARDVPLSILFTPSAADGSRRVAEWVRTRVAGSRDAAAGAAGDAVVLHGYDGRVRAEFASLRRHEAGLRLIAATAALDAEGLRTDVFAPPHWRITREGREALARHGFAVCADEGAVRDLRSGVVVRGRVQTFGGSQHVSAMRCRTAVLSTTRSVRRGGLVRLAVEAADLTDPGTRRAVIDAVEAAIDGGARPRTYASFAGADTGVAPRVPEQRVRRSTAGLAATP